LEDLKLLESSGLLKKGACIVGDMILYPGVPDFRWYVKDDPKYFTKEIEIVLKVDTQKDVDLVKNKPIIDAMTISIF
jgi:hypothetical protein